MSWVEEAFALIEGQQKGLERTAPWMVGEQLKEICRREPAAAELIAQDLKKPEMSLKEAEKKIKAWADRHKTGSFSCVPPDQAEQILRGFYGLGRPAQEERGKPDGICIDLSDFWG